MRRAAGPALLAALAMFALPMRAHAIVAGTDGIGSDSVGALPHIHQELRLLVEQGGLTPMETIVAGTRNAAGAAGLEASHGTVAVGKVADFLVLRADPTSDINNTRAIAFVVHRGRIVR